MTSHLQSWILQSRFARFALVGGAGFFVDAGVLYVMLHLFHLGPYAGRAISFLSAATFTWWGNRTLTFADHAVKDGSAMRGEWAKFVTANALGGAVNYGTYSALVALAPAPLNNPFLALACGSIAGLCFNFLMSKHVVFRARA